MYGLKMILKDKALKLGPYTSTYKCSTDGSNRDDWFPRNRVIAITGDSAPEGAGNQRQTVL